VNHLRRSGFDDGVIVAAGLASVTSNGYLVDRFRDRIVFVAHDLDLRPVGFIGRAAGTRLRYLNTPTTADRDGRSATRPTAAPASSTT
jgi:DNA primase